MIYTFCVASFCEVFLSQLCISSVLFKFELVTHHVILYYFWFPKLHLNHIHSICTLKMGVVPTGCVFVGVEREHHSFFPLHEPLCTKLGFLVTSFPGLPMHCPTYCKWSKTGYWNEVRFLDCTRQSQEINYPPSSLLTCVQTYLLGLSRFSLVSWFLFGLGGILLPSSSLHVYQEAAKSQFICYSESIGTGGHFHRHIMYICNLSQETKQYFLLQTTDHLFE